MADKSPTRGRPGKAGKQPEGKTRREEGQAREAHVIVSTDRLLNQTKAHRSTAARNDGRGGSAPPGKHCDGHAKRLPVRVKRGAGSRRSHAGQLRSDRSSLRTPAARPQTSRRTGAAYGQASNPCKHRR
jgi:hypothetical protein